MTPSSRLLTVVPAAIGGAVATIVVAVLVWPQWQQRQLITSRVAELRVLESQLPFMGAQLAREQDRLTEARGQQALVFQLIGGSGTLATFMAQVDRLAALSGVKLALYEPQAPARSVDDPKAAAKDANNPIADPADAGDQSKQPPPPPPDPLLLPGQVRQELLLSAAGRYPALVAFMRQLEKLNVLVVQSNLQLLMDVQQAQAAAAGSGNPPRRAPPPPVQLKMTVASYAQKPE